MQVARLVQCPRPQVAACRGVQMRAYKTETQVQRWCRPMAMHKLGDQDSGTTPCMTRATRPMLFASDGGLPCPKSCEPSCGAHSEAHANVWARPRLQGNEMEWRMFFRDGDKRISPWHDIPLKASGGAYNFVCEIPKESSAKMECAIVRHSQPGAKCSRACNGIQLTLVAASLRAAELTTDSNVTSMVSLTKHGLCKRSTKSGMRGGRRTRSMARSIAIVATVLLTAFVSKVVA